MIHGKISVNDYLIAQRLHRRSVAKWVNIATAALAACGLAMLLAGANRLGLIVLFGGVGGLVGEGFVANIQLPRRVAKLHAQQKDFAEQVTYSWDGQYIEAQSQTGSARRPWTHYAKVKEDEHIFLLYHSDNIFEMLPKSWFPSQELINEFRKLALRAAEA
jgi:hypothetical protein